MIILTQQDTERPNTEIIPINLQGRVTRRPLYKKINLPSCLAIVNFEGNSFKQTFTCETINYLTNAVAIV